MTFFRDLIGNYNESWDEILEMQSISSRGSLSELDVDVVNYDWEIMFLEDRIRKIAAAKKAFIQNIMAVCESIDDKMENIINAIQISGQKLKSSLEEIASLRNLEWTRQLQLCKDAKKNLRNADLTLLPTLSNHFSKSIGFINAGEIKFESSYELLIAEIEKFGKISYQTETLLAKPRIKFVIGERSRLLQGPWGVCSDETGRILVTDSVKNKVFVFSDCGECIFFFGKFGSGRGEFNNPLGIAVDKKLRIIVSDRYNHRVQVFNADGKFLMSIGRKGRSAGLFQHPWDVAVNENNDIAVSDNKNKRVQLFNSNGDFISEFYFNPNISDLNFKVQPRGVAFKPDGSLLVTDIGNRTVFLIDKFFSTATRYQSTSHIYSPLAVTCDERGFFAVSDAGRKSIEVFDNRGNLYKSFDMEQFDTLQGICLLPDGTIAATNFASSNILVF